MKRICSTRLAIVSSVALALAACAYTSSRPRYGGTLRVEMRERVNSMNPRDWFAGTPDSLAADRLLSQVFERLVALDDSGQIVPSLAIAWQHDANFMRWEFVLREGVKFHDGSPLTADAAAAALNAESSGRWSAKAEAQHIILTFDSPRPDLLAEFAAGKSYIFHANGDSVFGTGPFRISDWQSQKRLVLAANDDAWTGRPFADRVEVRLGVTPQQQILDLELGSADIIEVEPNLARRAGQSNTRVAASQPAELLAVEFSAGPEVSDPRLRRAISLAIDRASIVNVLLQRQGEPAASLLPQWLSGYAFVFSAAPNVALAKEIRTEVGSTAPLTLVYDGGDPVAALIASRIAVNARDAGIMINTAMESSGRESHAGLRLVRRRLSPPDAESALSGLLAQFELARAQAIAVRPELSTAQQRYEAERNAIAAGNVIPIAFLPELSAAAPSVHDWTAPRWGEWRLADAWLEGAPLSSQSNAGNSDIDRPNHNRQ
ncbi:MAG TPA: ABC transporter substrate-binding protein [Candidatus Acidoferrales bacterium]|nr:ABC transporter substrate-binding protein [Candidatus Acidoferrales bacterium]